MAGAAIFAPNSDGVVVAGVVGLFEVAWAANMFGAAAEADPNKFPVLELVVLGFAAPNKDGVAPSVGALVVVDDESVVFGAAELRKFEPNTLPEGGLPAGVVEKDRAPGFCGVVAPAVLFPNKETPLDAALGAELAGVPNKPPADGCCDEGAA